MAKRFKIYSNEVITQYFDGEHEMWFMIVDKDKRPITFSFAEKELRKLRRMITQCLRH